ncbi:hypothetical protein BABINDRAFT_164360 [Babjeviella inositovora NRRL Y-12698]|uniref:Uncharacterized protein n=1 Tax=Babjeviella inositovora NRRL Y-12698 TaxID=984486 RepID=A0A1E3QY38_9ASCO|nr:uncharacterized protein BABINDRAFT_164360 [Babjeviella inositovora NRRL Y-12698]ODQ82589.1 hypothetical protein BABINDRAFT_164360 [Babjeviella inositovora NRRL Y-12698]
MYLPNILPRDVHHLWLDATDTQTDSLHRHLNLQSQVSPHQRSLQQQLQEQEEQLNVVAPPLSSYSSAYPGAMPDEARNPSNLQTLAPDLQTRVNYLNSIRTLGFSYLKPLGVNKTMAHMMEEQHMLTSAFGTYTGDFTEPVVGTTENGFDQRNQQNPNTADRTFNLTNISGNGTSGINAEGTNYDTTNAETAPNEADLDAEIPDGDSYMAEDYDYEEDDENGEDLVDNHDFIDNDMEFMAVEEEYQEDHSDFFQLSNISVTSGRQERRPSE